MAGASLITFFAQYLTHPDEIGAFAPSSAALAAAVCRPLSLHSGPIRILEVGAGTGAITRAIIKRLKDRDHLDVCEPISALADVLERDVLSLPEADLATRQGRIQLHRSRLESLPTSTRYDVVIAGLPFNSFDPDLVRQLLERIRSMSAPGSTFSYYEYMAFAALGRTLGLGRTRRRLKGVYAVMRPYIERHQYDRVSIWLNVPPAWARHWRW